MAIPVLCDRCRATGVAGESDFSHLGDLLDFAPVPRRPRVNGWDADAQRAFIALLATTGSKRRAALAIGRNVFGIDQLLGAPSNDGFKLAYDRALAIAKQHGAINLAQGVADSAARNAQLTPSRLRGRAPDSDADKAMGDEAKLELIEDLARRFIGKVRLEREARLAGDVVAADFHLRQITMLEVAFDLLATDHGLDPWHYLSTLRRDGSSLLAVAETPFSRALDARRRAMWAAMADPDRPDLSPPHDLDIFETHSLAPLEALGPASTPPPGVDPDTWRAMTVEDQKLALADRHRHAAEEQVKWESQAVAEPKT